MLADATNFYAQWTDRVAKLRASAPEVARGFGSLFQTAMKAGEMSVREKELIALGISLAVRCDGCIYTHVQKALQAGANRQQIMETAGVAVMMQGGPTFTYLPKVVEALEALEMD